MRKLIILTGLILLLSIAYSQVLVDTNKIWNVVKCMNQGPCNTRSYKFGGDTLIDGTIYKKLLHTLDSANQTWYFHSAIREDSTGKVFHHYFQNEELLYDFGLKVGEVFTGLTYGGPVTMTVDSIDTIQLLNGELRKRLILGSVYISPEQDEWIVGIGSLSGITNVGFAWPIDVWYELNCFTENDTLKYDYPYYDPCYYTTASLEENLGKQKWSLKPNPFNNNTKLTYDFIQNSAYELRILNAQGFLIEVYNNITSRDIYIQGGSLSNGIYFFQLLEDGKIKLTGKLIKN
ncbi:MAG: T9SS type A sorting domain-containing protein [Bacteroidetes bacterium]|nr:T9SS type A sorting domain-containing protein [Bacteroidota bacterium]